MQLPVSAQGARTDSIVVSLPREVRSYENPLLTGRFPIDSMFDLEKKYVEVYKQRLDKEMKKEEEKQTRAQSMLQTLQEWKSEQRKAREEKDQLQEKEREAKLKEMISITTASEAECRTYLNRYAWDVKLATEQFFGGAGN